MAADGYYVFISYHPNDLDLVRYLAKALVDAGINVWLDAWNLVPGQQWQPAVIKAIGGAGAVLACIGSHDTSPSMQIEWSQANAAGVSVVPVLLPGAGAQIPSLLQGLHAVDLSRVKFVRAASLSSPRSEARPPHPDESAGNGGETGIEAGALRPLLERVYTLALERPASAEKAADTLIWKERLARLCRETGQFERARSLLEEVLNARQAQDPSTVITLADLAETEEKLGNQDRARSLFQRSLERSRQIFGEDRPTTFAASVNMVTFLFRHDDPQRLEPWPPGPARPVLRWGKVTRPSGRWLIPPSPNWLPRRTSAAPAGNLPVRPPKSADRLIRTRPQYPARAGRRGARNLGAG